MSAPIQKHLLDTRFEQWKKGTLSHFQLTATEKILFPKRRQLEKK